MDDFYEVVDKVVDLLKQRGRVTYSSLKIQFQLDDAQVTALREELEYTHESTVQADDRGFKWTDKAGDVPESTTQPSQPTQPDTQEAQPTPGEPQPAETHTPDAAERRQLTVMFVDMVGSTSLSGELDPEDYREVVRQYQQVCSEVIQRYDGHIAQYLGDGLLVYFGFPQAHEDDAHRSVRTGLGIIDAIETLNTRLEPTKNVKLAVRLGIHTGLVVIGEMGGEGRQEQLALGEVPNVAARIQGLAEPDTVVISADTHRLVEGYFDCDALGEHDLKGVAQPLSVHRVLQTSKAQNRLDVTSPRGLTPLVGRQSELQLLIDRWNQAKSGEGQVILLNAEPGLGKSRMVQALREQLVDEAYARLECRSSPYYQNTALYPVIDLVQRTLEWEPNESSDEKLGKLEQTLSQYRLSAEEAVPLMAGLLSLSLPEDRYPPLNMTPQRQRQKTLETVVSMLVELAEHQPVLFIVEDLHWTDPSTLELLNLLIDQVPTASIYTLLTCRPEFQAHWANRSYFTQVTLNRLSRDDIEQMVARVTEDKPLPDEVIQQLVDKTDGVPLYVEEMTKAVLESDVLKETDGRYELTGPVSSLSIPSTLQDSLMARLDRLVTAKAMAQYASVIGRQFSYELLLAVSELDEAMLQHELARLVEAELVYQRGLPPQASYTFKHALVQDTAYESLLRSTRQGYHRRIAEVLEERFPDSAENQPELLAHHYTEAGQTEQAVGYWQQAGEYARTRSAHEEAIAHLNKGLEALATLPETPERMQRELALQIPLALAYHASKGQAAPELERAYLRAQRLCEHIDDDHQLFRVLMGLYRCYGGREERQKTWEYIHELVRVAQRAQDPHLLLEAHMAQGTLMLHDGKFEGAREQLEQGITLYHPQDHHIYIAHSSLDPGVTTFSRASWTLWFLGYPQQALGRSQETLVLARELGHVYSLVQACNRAAFLHQFRREGRVVYEQAQAAMALATEHVALQGQVTAAILQGWCLASQGRSKEGIAQMQQGLTAYLASGTALYREWCLALQAEAYGYAGQSELGLATIAEAMVLVRGGTWHCWEPEMYRLKGDLLLQQSPDNATEAEACFQQAISIAQTQSAKSWELRAATSLARLWQQQNERQKAYDLLAPVFDWFTEGFDTADLIEAKTLLDELEGEQ